MRIFVVGPRFHGYVRAMAAALGTLGHDATLCEYDRASTVPQRLRNKAVHDLPAGMVPTAWMDEPSRRASAMLRETRPDAVLVIKGDLLSEDFWDDLDALGAPTVAWFYDELSAMRYDPEAIAPIATIATYSAVDAQTLTGDGRPAHHVPLGFDSLTAYHPVHRDEVTLIGARYPERERFMRELASRKVPVRAYGNSWSRRPFDVLRTRQFCPAGVPSEPNIDRAQAYGVMAGSRATVNMHGNQHGFTMRTFEACGVGGLQLIDRADVSDFYDPGSELLVCVDADEAAQYAQRAHAEPAWAQRIAEAGRRRTLAEHTLIHRMKQIEALWG
ncbi:MAG: glycosyltransferase [Bowdeniella nasicola]|nr:glycosyltransferase [Bowdeniella nasicola]